MNNELYKLLYYIIILIYVMSMWHLYYTLWHLHLVPMLYFSMVITIIYNMPHWPHWAHINTNIITSHVIYVTVITTMLFAHGGMLYLYIVATYFHITDTYFNVGTDFYMVSDIFALWQCDVSQYGTCGHIIIFTF